jgi:hypothetical protein
MPAVFRQTILNVAPALMTMPPSSTNGKRDDGVVWALQDKQANRHTLGESRSYSGPGGWQNLRAVCLMDTYSHLIRSVHFGAFATSEVSPFIAERMMMRMRASLWICRRRRVLQLRVP